LWQLNLMSSTFYLSLALQPPHTCNVRLSGWAIRLLELEKWQERRGRKERGGSISILAGRQASRLGGHPDKASAAGKRNDMRKKMFLLLFLSRQFFLLLPLFSTFPSWCQLQIHFAFLPFQSAFLFLSLIVLCFFQPLLVAHRRFFLRRIRRIRRRQLHK
jgi:hypothetical protein